MNLRAEAKPLRNRAACTMPDLASRSEATTSWVLLPIEETIPMPVTTTRLIRLS